ncbi:MAG TPA: tripartite tricarboxylate transporter substrate binding protein [Roseomonas sp.]|jgi:tripartite-type tricarboxylate transporter receptor subunit TctC
MPFTSTRRQALLAAAGIALPRLAWAGDTWPSRPVRLIVPFPAGGPMDMVARLVAPLASEAIGAPVIVDNRSGGTGTIAIIETARAAPDGHTLMITGSSWPVVPLLNPGVPFHMSDFAPLSRLTVAPLIFAVPGSLPVSSLGEFIEEARKRPGQWSYATSGIGSTLHLSTEMIKRRAGIDLVHVPYRGNGPAMTDLLAGRVQTMFPTIMDALPFLREGRLKALAVGYRERVEWLPEVPTLAEAGFGDVPASSDFGLACPAAVPAPIRDRLGDAFRNGARQPQIRQRLHDAGILVVATGAAEFTSLVADEGARFAEVIRTANISLN